MTWIRNCVFFYGLLSFTSITESITIVGSSNYAIKHTLFTLSCTADVKTQAVFLTYSTAGLPKTVAVFLRPNPDNTCQIAGSHNTNYTYRCTNDSSQVTYNTTIPGQYLLEDLHMSVWECTDPYNSSIKDSFTMEVDVPISTLNILPNKAEITVGLEESFTCTTDAGRPNAVIQWYLSNGTNLTNSALQQPECSRPCKDKIISTSTLKYTGRREDNGRRIYCNASNIPGRQVLSEEVLLNIKYGPLHINLYPNNQSYIVNETASVGPITCAADCNPNCTLIWTGTNFTGITSSPLSIVNITRYQTGMYQCRANNSISSVVSDVINITVHYGPKNVVLKPIETSYSVAEGGVLGPIECIAECLPRCKFKWDGPYFIEEVSKLQVTNISRNQSGDYKCTASNSIGRTQSETVKVDVIYGPSTVKLNPSITLYRVNKTNGHIGPIVCSANCRPNCTMLWYGPTLTGERNSLLYITNITRFHNGVYRCTAKNNVGNMSSEEITFIVQHGPEDVTLSPSKFALTVNETGDVGPILCTAVCMPNCNITWSGPNLYSGTESVLNLMNVSRNMTGDYICTAVNIFGQQNSSHVAVVVNYGPTYINLLPHNLSYIVNETSNVGPIRCDADCRPNCTFIWIGTNILEVASSDLSIWNITLNQEGIYQCRASNIIGSLLSDEINITVYYAPKNVRLTPTETSHSVVEGGVLGPIKCAAECKPDCKFQWDGPNCTVAEEVSILFVPDVLRSHSGDYTCTASNIVGRKSTTFTVDVMYGPLAVTIDPPTMLYTVNETDSVQNIVCSADCRPTCTMVWSGPRESNITASVLNLQNINRTQAGEYSCSAYNSVSSQRSGAITVIVYYSPKILRISGNSTYNENDTAKFQCYVDSIPKSTIKWIFVDVKHIEVLKEMNSNIVEINSMRCLSMGLYVCEATNSFGTANKSIDVTVICAPRLNTIEHRITNRIVLQEGSQLNIMAPIVSFPSPSIYWQFVRGIYTINITSEIVNKRNRQYTSLVIKNMTIYDFGTYTVFADNGIGWSKSYIGIYEVILGSNPTSVTGQSSLSYGAGIGTGIGITLAVAVVVVLIAYAVKRKRMPGSSSVYEKTESNIGQSNIYNELDERSDAENENVKRCKPHNPLAYDEIVMLPQLNDNKTGKSVTQIKDKIRNNPKHTDAAIYINTEI